MCAGWTQEHALQFWKEVEKITSKFTMFGFAAFVNDKDYREVFLGGGKSTKTQLDSRYGLCFRMIMSLVFKKVYDEEKRDDLTVNMVLEDGAQNSGDAERIFKLFKAHAPLARMAGTISFGKKKEFAGLQAADGAASGVFRLEKLPIDEPYYWPHDTWNEPVKTGRARVGGRVPIYRVEATPSILRELRDSIIAQDEERRRSRPRKAREPRSHGAPE
jgi:hypothetical protein